MNKAGGTLAAEELSARIKDYMKTIGLSPDHTDIVVRICADIEKLEVALFNNRKMTSGNSLYAFVHRFNQSRSLFDFVDVGASQESVERKTWGRRDL